jgi:hypothetical protein
METQKQINVMWKDGRNINLIAVAVEPMKNDLRSEHTVHCV